jgi:capsule polysaccharide export protein KpsC/LpsZ
MLFDALLRVMAVNRNIRTVCLENTFNKNKIIWDNVSGLTVNKNLAKNYFWKFYHLCDYKKVDGFIKKTISNMKSIKREQHISPQTKLGKVGENRTFLFLGQVYNDASQLFSLNSINNPIDVLESLILFCIKGNHNLIIKLHPKEKNGKEPISNSYYDRLTYRKLITRFKFKNIYLTKNIIIDSENDYDTYDLIKRSDVIVTITSQAGLEALLYQKPVIVNSNCFYAGLGFTYDYDDLEDLHYCLNKIQIKKMDERMIQRAKCFYYIFSEKYCCNLDESEFFKKVLL